MSRKHILPKGFLSMALVATALLGLLLPTQSAAVGKNQRLPNGHIVQDYYAPVKLAFIGIVEKFHMRPKIKVHNKRVRVYHVGDIDYTLRHIPNHPLALRRAAITCAEHPDLLSCSKTEEYMKKAIEWDPSQPNTHTLFGVFLQLQDRDEEAIKHYLIALRFAPTMADAHYNLALIYFDRENWDKSAEHAKAAYANGHRAPSLERKLREKGLM